MQPLRDMFRSTAEKLRLARPQLFPLTPLDLEVLERNLKPARNLDRIADINERAPMALTETVSLLKEFADKPEQRNPGLKMFAAALDDFAWAVYARRFGQNDLERHCVPKAAVKDLFAYAPILGNVVENELSNYDFRQHVVDDLPKFRTSLREFCVLALNLNHFASDHGLRVKVFEGNADFIEESAAACFPDIVIGEKRASASTIPANDKILAL